jgi:hypothetical protein
LVGSTVAVFCAGLEAVAGWDEAAAAGGCVAVGAGSAAATVCAWADNAKDAEKAEAKSAE